MATTKASKAAVSAEAFDLVRGVGKIRVAEVKTPAEDFSGVRRHVAFAKGRAVMAEPIADDFDKPGDWVIEHSSWELLLTEFKRDGYNVEYYHVEVD